VTIPSSSPAASERPTPATFSSARTAGDLIFTSGQVGLDPETNQLPEDFGDEVRQVIINLTQVLATAGARLEDVVKTTCFLTDMANLEDFNEIYEASFAEPRPARTALETGLARKFRVEIDAIAVIR
jgi:2-iminobutanoate/2-iminopropanoate deaminase